MPSIQNSNQRREKTVEICPKCGKGVAALTLLVGIVKIESFRCRCARAWRRATLTVSFHPNKVGEEIERLRTRFPGQKTAHVKYAINFMEAKLHQHTLSAMSDEERVRKRRLDMWEAKFLKEAIGDD